MYSLSSQSCSSFGFLLIDTYLDTRKDMVNNGSVCLIVQVYTLAKYLPRYLGR